MTSGGAAVLWPETDNDANDVIATATTKNASARKIMWGFAAPVDVERGIAYLPISGPAANYYGGDRPGRNDYANSVVAVDAQTGKYIWHFQTVHHG